MKVLFVNHSQKQCGVYQYGKRLADILKKDYRFNFEYEEIDDQNKFLHLTNESNYDYIVYNWHSLTMSWLDNNIILNNKKSKQILIFHELGLPSYLQVDGYIMTDLTEDEYNKRFSIPRPLFEYGIDKPKIEKLRFGSFGFGFDNKGFERICEIINQNYNDCVIHLHIPNAFYGDQNSEISNSVISRCRSIITNPTIDLVITTNFLTNEEILKFLNSNSLNLFLYDYMEGRGLSSTIDYALSVDTPFIVNNSYMFRHILNEKPNLSIDNSTIEEVIKNGLESSNFFREKWSNDNLRNKFFNILKKL